MFRAEVEAKGLSFEVDAGDSELRAPPLVITRILSNLLSNAIQHTASGHVSLIAQPSDNGYRFAVQNSAYLEHDAGAEALFEHGNKGDASTGAGYGLAIIRQLAEKAGLALGWRSDRTDGTEFTLAVPAKAVA
ncbi:sensor histidine kinase [Marimonas sp. MJW-29]|uniref:histidine kinase n=1 Tax=Sulfitobacter sediminis TaxID=3234186 RepID=A0ABV3RSW8_9RHOB